MTVKTLTIHPLAEPGDRIEIEVDRHTDDPEARAAIAAVMRDDPAIDTLATSLLMLAQQLAVAVYNRFPDPPAEPVNPATLN